MNEDYEFLDKTDDLDVKYFPVHKHLVLAHCYENVYECMIFNVQDKIV